MSGERPLWLIFPGMGSQSPSVVEDLMRIEVFAASINRSAAVLHPYGIDLLHIVTDTRAASEDVVSAIVGITTGQVALVDVLRALELRFDGFFGVSTGEIACAYADGALTQEQAVLTAYWRARSVLDAQLPPGAMAFVKLSWEESKAQCPPGIVPVCDVTDTCVSLSGPPEPIQEFVAKLSSAGTFAKVVNSTGVAFHSPYSAGAAPLMKERLERVITEPRRRSSRWLSSAIPPHRWNEEAASLCDAQYFVDNFISPVWGKDVMRMMPQRCITIEVAPKPLGQHILEEMLPEALYVPLLRCDSLCPVNSLLMAMAKLQEAGVHVRLSSLAISKPINVN